MRQPVGTTSGAMTALMLLLLMHVADSAALGVAAPRIYWHRGLAACRSAPITGSAIELQSDCGRGLEHLSARVQEGDVCVYQVGTWHVDWTEVGSGNPPRLLLVRCDCLQLNWVNDHEVRRLPRPNIQWRPH